MNKGGLEGILRQDGTAALDVEANGNQSVATSKGKDVDGSGSAASA